MMSYGGQNTTWQIPRGGVTLICSSYVGSDPVSTVHSPPPPQKKKKKKYQEFQASQKLFEILATQKDILTLRKDPKMYRNNP